MRVPGVAMGSSERDRIDRKVEFAREWYSRGVCPGCGAPLVKVAGVGTYHWLGGQEMIGSGGRIVLSVPGAIASGVDATDPRLCPWSADQLAALVHIGSGLSSLVAS